jgi:hypothetical protein
VARNDDRESIRGAERAGCALSPWIAGKTRKLAVRNDLSERDAAKRGEDVELEWRPPVHLERDLVERRPLASEVGAEPADQLFRFRLCSVTPASAFGR